MADALALEWMRRRQIQADAVVAWYGAEIVERIAKAVNHPAHERIAHRHAQSRTKRDDFAARMNTANFAERHEQDMVIPKTDHFSQRRTIVPRGFDAADFTDCGERAFGFDNEPDELNHTPVTADDLRFLDPAQKSFEPH